MNQHHIASYCTTFLKREMYHIYRQITGLQRYRTTVITQQRQNSDLFPFDHLVELPAPRINLISRGIRKYIRREEPLLYRGEYDVLVSALEQINPQLMHIYFGHTAVHLLPLIRRWSKPIIVSFHGMDVMLRPNERRYEHNLREVFERVRLVLARSESLKARLINLGCDPQKIRINRTSIPLDAFPFVERTWPTDNQFHLIQVCRFIEKKGLTDTLTAFAAFHQNYPQAQLHLVGDGPLRGTLDQQAQALRIASNVHFHGFLNQPALLKLLTSSHIFIHPSKLTASGDQEGIPNAMLEAMATGLPVVATLHGGIPEAVINNKTGYLTPESDPQALTDSLMKLTADRDRYQQISRAASTHIHQEFSPKTQIQRLESYYDAARASRS